MQRPIFQTLFLGQNLQYFDSIPSTNKKLGELLLEKPTLSEGFTVLAGHQTSGRGQYGNKWLVEPHKNLTFSFLLKPNFLFLSQHFYLNKVVSLGVKEGLAQSLGHISGFDPHELYVKWPNDVLYKNKKWAGILIENSIRGSVINQSIVGVGLNLNQEKFDASHGRGSSPKVDLGVEVDQASVFNAVVTQVEKHYLAIRSGGLKFIDKSYISNLYMYNSISRFKMKGKDVEGKIIGVGPEGHLQIETSDGMVSCDFKEVEFLF